MAQQVVPVDVGHETANAAELVRLGVCGTAFKCHNNKEIII